MILRPYQRAAADFLYDNDRAMVLAPVGAGKTATALDAIYSLVQDTGYRVLVLAPLRVAQHVWPAEAEKWAPELHVEVACGSPKERIEALRSRAEVVVTNYDSIEWLVQQPEIETFRAVVFDELTRLKNPSGKRFKALEKAIKHIEVRWGLTGSFTSNGLEDVFGQCKIIQQSMLGRSKGAFLQLYFHCVNQEFNQWAPRHGALEHVMGRIRPWTYLLEAGVYTDTLPPLHTVEVPCQMDMAPYRKMQKEFVLEFEGQIISAVTAAAAGQKLQQLAAGFVYDEEREAHWTHTVKLDRLAELLEENQRAPTIVFYQFQAEYDALRQRYPHAGTVDDIDLWNRGDLEVLLLHPAAAGHGLNLQHGGHHVVFLSLPWSLELYEQAIGRLHRSGQQHPVWCYVMLMEGTVDEKMWTALRNKRSVSDAALEALR
jgi:hypothetical protein